MIFVTALVVGIYFSAQVAEPLERLLRETDRVGHMDLSASPVTHSVVLEVDRLGEAVERMKTGLRSFLKYVPGEIVRQTVTSQRESEFGGCRKPVTVLFSDIVDFTAFAETSNRNCWWHGCGSTSRLSPRKSKPRGARSTSSSATP